MEFLDIVDENDKIIGKASYKEVYDRLLTHRITHILIFNSKGEMLLQLRSKNKDFCPLHWGTSVGGHVRSGESYEDAAKREFQEELGTKTDITFLRKDFYVNNKYNRGLKKFLGTFTTTFNGPFKINPKEVEKIEFVSLKKIQDMINKGEKFHPELLFILRKTKSYLSSVKNTNI